MRLRYVRSFAFLLLLGAGLASGLSCARYPQQPSSVTPGTRKRLIISMTVRGEIQPSDAQVPYYYFFLINRTDDAAAAGPVPVVIGPQWGNGFAAPAPQPADGQGFVGFVRYDRFQGQSGYGVYTLQNPTTGVLQKPIDPQLQFFPLGPPDVAQTLQRGEKQLYFELNLDRLPNPEARFLQINFVATNNIPQGVDENAPKSWDALGNGADTDTINAWVRIDTTQNITIRNSERLPDLQEPPDDVREKLFSLVDEPNLDIVDWTIEVRTQP